MSGRNEHDVLLQKLETFGVKGMVKSWFKSYLTDRSQVLDGEVSQPLPVDIGVPQGSILGPLLFSLYINDLPDVTTKCDANMYADDTEIDYASKSASDLEETINADLSTLQKYFIKNKLSINVKKCEYMLVGTHQALAKFRDICIKIGNISIQKVHFAKYLGMLIDENLKWGHHIDNMVKKISCKIGILRKVRKFVPNGTLKLIYNATVQPHFDYCDVVYDSASQTNKDRLQRLQSRAARILTGSAPMTSRNSMFKQLNWLSLQNRRIFNKCVLVFKCLHNLAPRYLIQNYSLNSEMHSYNTRSAKKLHTDIASTQYYANSFLLSSQRCWNDLPANIRDCDSITGFKSKLLAYMHSNVQF